MNNEDFILRQAHPMYAAFCREDDDEPAPRLMEDMADDAYERWDNR